jgi:hypothetical protein
VLRGALFLASLAKFDEGDWPVHILHSFSVEYDFETELRQPVAQLNVF